MKLNRRLALGALLVMSCLPAGAAELDGRLSGAWATSKADCQKLFIRRGAGYSFRQPIDKFAQAAIITPGTIFVPSQTCQVTSISHDKGLATIAMECKDDISYTSQSVEIEIRSDTEMVYRPNGDKTLDTTFVKCSL